MLNITLCLCRCHLDEKNERAFFSERVQVLGVNQQVMLHGMVFAGVVSPVFGAFCPQIRKEGLRLSAFQPLDMHVHAFGC